MLSRISQFFLVKPGAPPNTRLERLPADIVLSIIDYVSLPQLICMAHVCRGWRVLAYSHPTFWQVIHVVSIKPAALECMLARLAVSDAPIARVVLTLIDDEPAIEAVVLPALAAHLHRIEDLRATLHPSKAAAFFHALRAGGPRLKELEITFHSEQMNTLEHVFLPSDLLGGRAPHLLRFTGGNVRLPHAADPVAVFANVFGVVWMATRTTPSKGDMLRNTLRVSPRLLSVHFPCMRDLALSGRNCWMDRGFELGAFSTRLRSLYLDLGYAAGEPLLFVPPAIRPLPSITFASPRAGQLSMVLAEISTSSSLRCRIGRPREATLDPRARAGNVFEVELGHLHDSTTRRALERFSDFPDGRRDTPPLFVDASWCARVTELVLEHRIWCTPGIMKWIAPFTALRRLTLLIDECDLAKRPAAKLVCPALKTIVVTSATPELFRVPSEILTEYLHDGLMSPIESFSFRVDVASASLIHQSDSRP